MSKKRSGVITNFFTPVTKKTNANQSITGNSEENQNHMIVHRDTVNITTKSSTKNVIASKTSTLVKWNRDSVIQTIGESSDEDNPEYITVHDNTAAKVTLKSLETKCDLSNSRPYVKWNQNSVIQTIAESTDEDNPESIIVQDNTAAKVILKSPETKCDPSTSTPYVKNTLWPNDWTFQQWQTKKAKYDWLICFNGKLGCSVCQEIKYITKFKHRGVEISSEWSECKIGGGKSNRKETRLSVLRNKIKRHVSSTAHKTASTIVIEKESDLLTKQFENSQYKIYKSTETIFRSAYFIAKNNRPFSDHFKLLELQKLNGIDIGSTLHSQFSSANIISHIASEMKKKVIKNIVNSNSKLSVLIDESTTMSTLSAMVVYIKSSISNDEPVFVFLDLVELSQQTAQNITEQLLDCLHKAGLNDEFLKNNWISFVSDGASVLLGKKAGVAKLLKDKYPLIFSWHCLNHRLELSVNDTMKEINATFHFKSFIDSLYKLYNNSPKNKNELKIICGELDIIFLNIGRVLDVRWVASSWRAVKSVWRTFPALCSHFQSSSNDLARDAKSRSKYLGLYQRLTSPEFISDLAVICDVLSELSFLSLALQSKDITLLQADSKIKRTIRVIESFKHRNGEHMDEFKQAQKNMKFKNVKLTSYSKINSININQFITSICNNLNARLLDDYNTDSLSILQDICVLDKNTWPESIDVRYGEEKVKRICSRFLLNKNNAVDGFRAYVEEDNNSKKLLLELKNCIKTLPCSTAECERGFSLLNLICNDLRSRLTIEHISQLMFIKLNGPPLYLWKPELYVKSWLVHYRCADDTRSKNVKSETEIQSIWNIL